MRRDQITVSALSRLFSATVFRELGKQGHSPLAGRLLAQTRVPDSLESDTTLRESLDQAFHVLKTSGRRDEYVYRSAIVNKIVLGRHSLRTATLLNELRAGQCKADAVVLNGTSTAYEIKSERDSLSRLEKQITNYRQVFASVNVVTSPAHLDQVLANTTTDVGVIALSDHFTLQTVRAPENRPERTSPTTVLETLRNSEALSILDSIDIKVPEVPNTQLRGTLREIFATLDPVVAHNAMVSTLKRARSQHDLSPFISLLPISLRAVGLTTKLSVSERARLLDALETPLDAALNWS